ncbi:zf-HC2 domain-containing protein [Dactylosporangium siamense]|uniref:Membrane protein n=1 Tax=Dactylosporangium siamense TaxID=685454 RepID=A0A919PKJ2_9ACTN|nr:zf-HC2 domain-containing protein [Dactylosporangium siamense]GIG44916.1 membrane protein [Dactylosporangium siamense]
MGCDQYQEALSARLDGEDEPVPAAETDAHLRRCNACQTWQRDALAVTRMVRVQPVTATSKLDVAALLDRFRPVLPRVRNVLRVALGTLGAAQFLLGMAQVARNAAADHVHAAAAAGATAGHLWHESAAWNVAVGAGFAFSAWSRRRPTGALPILSAFVALLALLSVNDMIAGQVQQIRLASHGFVLAGYLIVLALCHPRLDPGTPPSSGLKPRWRLAQQPLPDPVAPPKLRLIQGHATASTADLYEAA